MYGTRDYLAHLGYGAMRFFQNEILRGHGNFWSRKKIPVPYSHKYCTVPYNAEEGARTFFMKRIKRQVLLLKRNKSACLTYVAANFPLLPNGTCSTLAHQRSISETTLQAQSISQKLMQGDEAGSNCNRRSKIQKFAVFLCILLYLEI